MKPWVYIASQEGEWLSKELHYSFLCLWPLVAQFSLPLFLHLIVNYPSTSKLGNGLDLLMMRIIRSILINHVVPLGLAIGWLGSFPSSLWLSALTSCPIWNSSLAMDWEWECSNWVCASSLLRAVNTLSSKAEFLGGGGANCYCWWGGWRFDGR